MVEESQLWALKGWLGYFRVLPECPTGLGKAFLPKAGSSSNRATSGGWQEGLVSGDMLLLKEMLKCPSGVGCGVEERVGAVPRCGRTDWVSLTRSCLHPSPFPCGGTPRYELNLFYGSAEAVYMCLCEEDGWGCVCCLGVVLADVELQTLLFVS